MNNNSDDHIIIRKITESVDNSEMQRILGEIISKLLERPDKEQFVCKLIETLSRDEADLIKNALETSKFIVHESYQLYERSKKEHENSLRWKRVFGFASPSKLSAEASDLAFREMKKMANYFSSFQKKMVGNVTEMRKQLTGSYSENIGRLIENGSGKLLDARNRKIVRLEGGNGGIIIEPDEFEIKQ